jgi:hypothetical protein
MRLMLDPKSMRAFPTLTLPMVTGKVTLPGSFSFFGRVL